MRVMWINLSNGTTFPKGSPTENLGMPTVSNRRLLLYRRFHPKRCGNPKPPTRLISPRSRISCLPPKPLKASCKKQNTTLRQAYPRLCSLPSLEDVTWEWGRWYPCPLRATVPDWPPPTRASKNSSLPLCSLSISCWPFNVGVNFTRGIRQT